MTDPITTASAVDELIKGRQYDLLQAEKEARLLPLVQDLARRMSDRCPPYHRFLKQLSLPIDEWQSLSDILPLPVSMFKHFILQAVPSNEIVRELNSSATTGQNPSRIFIDKTTAFRQARSLVSILKEHIGGQRRPYLVLDARESVGVGDQINARSAAIRGVGNFAETTDFALVKQESGDLQPDFDGIAEFCKKHRDVPVLLFGFTFIVWTKFVIEAERRGVTFSLPHAVVLHSGGWKKLKDQAVSKEDFSNRLAKVLNCRTDAILDFYGMIEQVGTVFVDCEAGAKHAPAFADVIIRAPHTLRPVSPGESGVIEVMSVLPTSYPGQALITEDQGIVLGVDDCSCGRKGRYFRFTSRVEQAEIRGCGDIYGQAAVKK